MDIPCSRCERGIPPGEPHWSVNVHREVVEDDGIEVLDAVCYFSFCAECAAQVDLENLVVPERPAR